MEDFPVARPISPCEYPMHQPDALAREMPSRTHRVRAEMRTLIWSNRASAEGTNIRLQNPPNPERFCNRYNSTTLTDPPRDPQECVRQSTISCCGIGGNSRP